MPRLLRGSHYLGSLAVSRVLFPLCLAAESEDLSKVIDPGEVVSLHNPVIGDVDPRFLI